MTINTRSTSARFVLGTLVAGLLVVLGWFAYEQLRPGRTNVIRPSFAFDPTDRKQMANHAENVFLGRVTEVVDVDVERGPYTVFKIEIQESLKGNLQGTILVRQLGGKVGKDVWVVENEQPLVVGTTYLLVTNKSLVQPEAQILLSGPLGHEVVNSETERANARAAWRAVLG